MTTQHSAIADAELHEPKGVAGASSGTVYIADGAGSGSWSPVVTQAFVTAEIDDISTAGSHWVVTPVAGTVSKIYSVIDSAITVADANLSFEIAGTPITGGGITVAFSGSAAGDVDSSTPSAANTVSAGQAIELITDGGSTDSCKARVTFVIDVV